MQLVHQRVLDGSGAVHEPRGVVPQRSWVQRRWLRRDATHPAPGLALEAGWGLPHRSLRAREYVRRVHEFQQQSERALRLVRDSAEMHADQSKRAGLSNLGQHVCPVLLGPHPGALRVRDARVVRHMRGAEERYARYGQAVRVVRDGLDVLRAR